MTRVVPERRSRTMPQRMGRPTPHRAKAQEFRFPGSPAAGLLEGGQCGDSLTERNLADGDEEAPLRRTEGQLRPIHAYSADLSRPSGLSQWKRRGCAVEGLLTASRCRWFSRRMGGKPTASGPFLQNSARKQGTFSAPDVLCTNIHKKARPTYPRLVSSGESDAPAAYGC